MRRVENYGGLGATNLLWGIRATNLQGAVRLDNRFVCLFVGLIDSSVLFVYWLVDCLFVCVWLFVCLCVCLLV